MKVPKLDKSAIYYEKVNDGGCNVIVLNIDSLGSADILDQIKPFLKFPVRTYTKLIGNKESKLRAILPTVNDVFAHCSKEQQIAIVECLAHIHADIDEFFSEDNPNIKLQLRLFVEHLGARLANLDADIGLMSLLYAYAPNVLEKDFSKVGREAYHNPETTFFEEDYKQVISISILCKIMSPILGTLMIHLKNLGYPGRDREIKLLPVVDILISKTYPEIVDKLKGYIDITVSKIFSDSKTESDRIHSGYDKPFMILHMYANLMLRTYVSIDLYTPGSDIMTFSSGSIKLSASGSIKNSELSYRHRDESYVASDDASTPTKLELGSSVSSRSRDIEILTRVAVSMAIKHKICPILEIDYSEVTPIKEWYTKYPPSVTTLNKALVGSCLGNLVTSISVNSMDINSFCEAVTIMQYYCIKLRLMELAVMMTCNETDTYNNVANSDMSVGYITTPSYLACKKRYAESDIPNALANFEQLIQDIISTVTLYKHKHNICPDMWPDKDQAKKLNGTIIPLSHDTIIEQFCQVLDSCMDRR